MGRGQGGRAGKDEVDQQESGEEGGEEDREAQEEQEGKCGCGCGGGKEASEGASVLGHQRLDAGGVAVRLRAQAAAPVVGSPEDVVSTFSSPLHDATRFIYLAECLLTSELLDPSRVAAHLFEQRRKADGERAD